MPRKRLKTEKVIGPNGVDVRVMFYEDGCLRFRVVGAGPMRIFEAFLPGKNKDVIISLAPYSN